MRMLEGRAAALPPVGTVRRRAPGYRGSFDPSPLSALWRPHRATLSVGGPLVLEPLERRVLWAPDAERTTFIRSRERSPGEARRISYTARGRSKPRGLTAGAGRSTQQPQWHPIRDAEGVTRGITSHSFRCALPAPAGRGRGGCDGTDAELWLGFPSNLFGGFVAAVAA